MKIKGVRWKLRETNAFFDKEEMGYYINFAESLDKRIEIEYGNIGDHDKNRFTDILREETKLQWLNE